MFPITDEIMNMKTLKSIGKVMLGSLSLAAFMALATLAHAGPPIPVPVPVPVPAPGVAVSGEIEVNAAPPAPLVEVVPPTPGVDFVWIPGAWGWHDRWVWERGHYDRPPHPGAVWAPHRYEYREGKHMYRHGDWR
jgi:hypothetical protein